MIKLNDIFPNIFIININECTDRWEKTKEILSNENIVFERIEGCVINNGTNVEDRLTGCTESHKKCVQIAKQRGYKNILIFEDDIGFDERYPLDNYLPIVKSFIDNNKWHSFYLGGNHINRFSKINENIIHINNTKTTHALAINDSVYDIILKWNSYHTPPDDLMVNTIQKLGYSYCIFPRLLYQRAGKSIILNDFRDYTDCLLEVNNGNT